jgi:hypothetical protein
MNESFLTSFFFSTVRIDAAAQERAFLMKLQHQLEDLHRLRHGHVQDFSDAT